MKSNALESLKPQYRIGFNCFFMNVSAVFEYQNILWQALAYTNLDFLYDKEHFLEFLHDEPPELCFDENNQLLVTRDIGSIFRDDMESYAYNQFLQVDCMKIERLDKPDDLSILQDNYLQYDVPIIFPCDHYYTYEEYKAYNNDMKHFHSGRHMTVLADIDFKKNKCSIIDKFYTFIGEISIEAFNKAISSEYIEEETQKYMYTIQSDFGHADRNEQKHNFLKRNIETAMSEYAIVNGRSYHKGIKALKMFLDDLEENIRELLNGKRVFAARYLTNMLQPTRLQRGGYSWLMEYMREELKHFDELNIICELTKDIAKQWRIADNLCDKCFYSGDTLGNYSGRIRNVLNEAYNNEIAVYEQLNKIYPKL